MKGLVLISAIFMQVSWSHSFPNGPQGAGAFAYQDSTGNRYGGTYTLKDGKVEYNGINPQKFSSNEFFAPQAAIPFSDASDFFPSYFANFQNLLQEFFPTNFEGQKLALEAARKAFDLTSNQAAYIPNFDYSFPSFADFGGFGNFGAPGYGLSGFADPANFRMPNNFGAQNSAFAGAASGPGFARHFASINPVNAQMPNINKFMETPIEPGKPQFHGVYSSSYAKSTNINGKEKTERGAKTYVNNNGKITEYSLNS